MFKKGSLYTRKDVGWIVLPETGRPKGGSWDTGYGLITWFGKPNSHSGQPIFQKLIDKSLSPQFFARWDNKDPRFTYIGNGNVVRYDDQAETRSGIKAIKLLLSVDDAELILPSTKVQSEGKSSFMFERHLEDFLVTNWERTHLGNKYKITRRMSAGWSTVLH